MDRRTTSSIDPRIAGALDELVSASQVDAGDDLEGLRIAEARVSACGRVCEAGVRDRKNSHLCERVVPHTIDNERACVSASSLVKSQPDDPLSSPTQRIIDLCK